MVFLGHFFGFEITLTPIFFYKDMTLLDTRMYLEDKDESTSWKCSLHRSGFESYSMVSWRLSG